MKNILFAIILSSILLPTNTKACSIVYFIDKLTGKIYVANNEDYWYDVKPSITITPSSKNTLARLWYGWDNYAQGGINEAGLFFDGASTPKQELPKGYKNQKKNNLGDAILASCKTLNEALEYLEKNKVAVNEGHMLIGDALGNAAVVEWIDGKKIITTIGNSNRLIATNYLLAKPSAGNYPCKRYESINSRIDQLTSNNNPITFLSFCNTIGGAAQPPQKNSEGKIGGTLYSSFINITDMEFVLVYKLDNKKLTKLDLKTTFANKTPKTIELE